MSVRKYGIIYADPPWTYNDKANAGKRGASHKYSCMTPGQLAVMRVAGRHVWELAADDCALFMWATAPLMMEAIGLFAEWEFQYKTIAFVWVKTTKNGQEHFGMGNWTRANAEYLLIGTRGRPKRESASVRQVVHEQVLEHSRKPHVFRRKIVQLVGDLPRIELFARELVRGWDAWGHGVDPLGEVLAAV